MATLAVVESAVKLRCDLRRTSQTVANPAKNAESQKLPILCGKQDYFAKIVGDTTFIAGSELSKLFRFAKSFDPFFLAPSQANSVIIRGHSAVKDARFPRSLVRPVNGGVLRIRSKSPAGPGLAAPTGMLYKRIKVAEAVLANETASVGPAYIPPTRHLTSGSEVYGYNATAAAQTKNPNDLYPFLATAENRRRLMKQDPQYDQPHDEVRSEGGKRELDEMSICSHAKHEERVVESPHGERAATEYESSSSVVPIPGELPVKGGEESRGKKPAGGMEEIKEESTIAVRDARYEEKRVSMPELESKSEHKEPETDREHPNKEGTEPHVEEVKAKAEIKEEREVPSKNSPHDFIKNPAVAQPEQKSSESNNNDDDIKESILVAANNIAPVSACPDPETARKLPALLWKESEAESLLSSYQLKLPQPLQETYASPHDVLRRAKNSREAYWLRPGAFEGLAVFCLEPAFEQQKASILHISTVEPGELSGFVTALVQHIWANVNCSEIRVELRYTHGKEYAPYEPVKAAYMKDNGFRWKTLLNESAKTGGQRVLVLGLARPSTAIFSNPRWIPNRYPPA